MEQKNNKWINIILLVLELPIAYFFIYFSIGLKEHVIDIFKANPYEVFFMKVCGTFLFLLVLNISLLALIKAVMRFKFSIMKFVLINGICLLFMVLLIATYKLLTNGYV